MKIDPDEIIRLYDQDDQKIMARIQQPDDQRQSVLERRRARRRKKRIRFFLLLCWLSLVSDCITTILVQ